MWKLTRGSYVLWFFVRAVGLLMLAGCNTTPPSSRQWVMTFATPEGKAVLASVATRELFEAGTTPPTLVVIPTKGFCRAVSRDPLSGRIATVEGADRVDAVRVYTQEAVLLAEYRCGTPYESPRIPPPRLSKGGRCVAFFCEQGAICIGAVDKLGEQDAVNIRRIPASTAPPRNRTACFWLDEHTLVVGYGSEIYRVPIDGDEAEMVSSNGLLCGVADGSVVATSSMCCFRYRLWDALTGKRVGSARSGHSYASLEGLSPDGEYVAYIVPGAFWSKGHFYIHHLDSGRRALLSVSPRWNLGSWTGKDNY